MDISIVICTFNPDVRILERCLRAVAQLRTDGLQVEYLLIDNNSHVPIGPLQIVKWFLLECPTARLIVEKEQGLTSARIRGFRESSGNFIVFFDDDNEPASDYLLAGTDFARHNPGIGAFGPGIVEVEFVDGAEEWLYDHKGYFQESAISEDLIGSSTSDYPPCNPYGTGLVLRRQVMEKYSDLVGAGAIRTTDRKGDSLASAGDLQIIWLALREGYLAGKSPDIRLRHIINGKKANRKYIKRFLYGGGRSYLPARLEIFPEEKKGAQAAMMSPVKASFLCVKLLLTNAFKWDLAFTLAGQIGSIDGYCEIFGRKTPRLVAYLRKRFDLM